MTLRKFHWGMRRSRYHCRFSTREEACKVVTEYVGIFYKQQTKQARLGYFSPAAYTQQFPQKATC
jgi:putative transposase